MTHNEKQPWDALALEKHGCIEASAGTGKTYTIEQLVVRILTTTHNQPFGRSIDLEELLIVTYTEKAAAQLRQRIRALLLVQSRENPNEEIRARLRGAIARFDRAAIYTIHGFCNRYLTHHAFETHNVVGAALGETAAAARQAVLRYVRGPLQRIAKTAQNLTRMLDSWGFDSVEALCETVVPIAIAYEPGSTDRLLPLAPADPAAAQETLVRSLAACIEAYPIETHPFLQWDPQRIAAASALTKPPQRAMLNNRVELLRGLMVSFPVNGGAEAVDAWINALSPKVAADPFEGLRMTASSIEQISSTLPVCGGLSFTDFTQCVADLLALKNTMRFTGLFQLLDAVGAAVARFKEEQGVVSYDDMIKRFHASLLRPGSSLLPLLRRTFRYGIIDEFQDTNALQWDIFRQIFSNTATRTEPPGYLYVVGDPKQSIFSFQGSDVTVYRTAMRECAATGVQVALTVNYRSSQPMIGALNTIFCQGDWFDTNASAISYTPQSASPTIGQPQTAPNAPVFGGEPVLLRNLTVDANGNPISGRQNRAAELADWICSRISMLLSIDQGVTPLRLPEAAAGLRNTLPGDICILVEKHSESALIIKKLRSAGIASTKQRNFGLFSSVWAVHITAVLHAIDSENDPAAGRKALLTDYFGITVAQLARSEAGETLPAVAAGLLRIAALAVLAHKRRWVRLFTEIVNNQDFLARLKTDEQCSLALGAIRQLRTFCLRLLLEKQMTLTEVVARLRALHAGTIDEHEEDSLFHKESDAAAVQVLTMHSCKGLEFPIVFIAGGKATGSSPRSFYSMRNHQGGTDFWLDAQQGKKLAAQIREQELRRLYYVALTRARYLLCVPIWDDVDETSGAILSSAKGRSDTSSASALFLSAALAGVTRQAAADPALSPLFRIDTLPNKISPYSPMPGTNLHADSAIIVNGVPRVSGQIVLPSPKQRMTRQQSYSGIVRLTQTLGIRTNPGSDEQHQGSLLEGRHVPLLIPSALTGDALHAVLEQADFSAYARAASAQEVLHSFPQEKALIYQSFAQRGLIFSSAHAERLIAAAAECVYATLCAAITDPACDKEIVLSRVDRCDRMAETSFCFSFSPTGELRCTAGHDVSGWVVGFVDLLLRSNGRYYIIDWKSNWLDTNDYSASAIYRNMIEHRYDVQYKVYSIALHAWLADRIPGYTPEQHFGGVIYCYIRGTRALQGDSGVWSVRPTPHELTREWPGFLTSLLSNPGKGVPR